MVDYVWEVVDCCPVCGGAGTFDISNVDPELGMELIVYYCQNCKSSYHNPRMSQNSMAEYYSSGKYRSLPKREIDEATSVERLAGTVELIATSTRVKPARCLDVGCSRGYLTRALHERFGAEVVGYDVYHDPQAVIDVVDHKDGITGTFDVITCIHVLEHFADPLSELSWMASLLGENGMLVIEIPMIRVVTVPHPILFSREAVPLLMKHIDAEYVFIDAQYLGIGVIAAWKSGAQL
jgi:2-polyprenyl-3-methyl-5-hydroxy-6-metoxy-1,4-benzoquinol methylase